MIPQRRTAAKQCVFLRISSKPIWFTALQFSDNFELCICRALKNWSANGTALETSKAKGKRYLVGYVRAKPNLSEEKNSASLGIQIGFDSLLDPNLSIYSIEILKIEKPFLLNWLNSKAKLDYT